MKTYKWAGNKDQSYTNLCNHIVEQFASTKWIVMKLPYAIYYVSSVLSVNKIIMWLCFFSNSGDFRVTLIYSLSFFDRNLRIFIEKNALFKWNYN